MSRLPELDPDDRRLALPKGTGGPIGIAAIAVAFTELRSGPEHSAPIDSQLIFGETVDCHDVNGEYTLVRAHRDKYVGWVDSATLRPSPPQATHLVRATRTFLYPEPDMKLPHKGMRSMASALTIIGEETVRGTAYSILDTGEAIITAHIRPQENHDSDYVAIAREFVRTPYLWAGTSAFGFDCSGLVKQALFMCGQNVLRDSDLQAATLGIEIDSGLEYGDMKRGDLLFWRGHVGICEGKDRDGVLHLLHCNGHTMDVTSEPLLQAVERIAYLFEKPIGARRP